MMDAARQMQTCKCVERRIELQSLQSRLDRAHRLLREYRDVIQECMSDYGVKDGGSILRRLDEFLAEREG